MRLSVRLTHNEPKARRQRDALLAGCGLVLSLMWLAPAASGDITVSLPTEGHFRPGRFLPVRIEGAARAGTLTLSARGMIPTQISDPEANDLVIPWLAFADSTEGARWDSADGASHPLLVPLHALGDDERLVAFAGAPPDAGKLLFPDKAIVPVSLDMSRPLLEPAEDWECLDAVVLSSAAAARLDGSHRLALLAAGTTIAVRSDVPPADRLAWARLGEYWVARYVPAGPVSIVEPDAYAPTYDWVRGWPVRFRRAAFFAAVLFCILAGAVLLWRSRWAVLAFVALTAIDGTAFAAWYAGQSPGLELAAAIQLEDGRMSQFDLWTWLSPLRPADASFPAGGLTRPVFATARQPEQTGIRLLCSSDGRTERYAFHLEPGQSLAMLSRAVRAGAPPPPMRPNRAPASRPFANLTNTLYIGPQDRIEGEYPARTPGAAEAIPVIVVRRNQP